MEEGLEVGEVKWGAWRGTLKFLYNKKSPRTVSQTKLEHSKL